MSARNNLNPAQFYSREEWDAHLESEFHPQQLEARTVPHPKTGYAIKAGLERRVAQPQDEREGPAVFNVRDYGNPSAEGFNSLKNMLGTGMGQEPIRHVYRAMSDEEWSQARQRGYIQSDQRGTIASWEGTNAGVDPQTAASYSPFGGHGNIAKIRVQPEDRWFTVKMDDYIRTRNRIPLDRVEHVAGLTKDEHGVYLK